MPKIPIMGGPKKESVGTQQPTLEYNRAGIVAGALSGLGGEVAEIGMELYKRRQKEELMHWGAESFNQFGREMNQQEMALKQKYAGTDYKGYAQEYDKVLTETKQRYLNSADSDSKRKFLDDKTTGYSGEKLIYADKYENEEKRNYYINATANRIENIGGNGDYIAANRDFQEQEEIINSSEYFSNDVREKLNEQMGKSAIKTIDSMIIQKNTKQAMAILDGKDPKNSENILKRLTPYEIEQLKAKAVNSEMSLKNELYRSVQSTLRNTQIALQTGELLPTDEEVIKAKARINELPEGMQSEARSEFTILEAQVEAQKSFALLPDSKRNIEGFVADKAEKLKFTDPIEAAAFRGELKQKLQTLSSQMDAQYKKDPTKYLMTFDPDLANLANQAIVGDNKAFSAYKSKLDTYYDQRGELPKNREYLSPGMKEYFGGQLENIFTNKPEGGADLALKLFNDFEKMAGNDGYGLLREMKLKESYGAIGEITNEVARKQAIKNELNPVTPDGARKPGEKDAELNLLRDNDLYLAYRNVENDQESIKNADYVLDIVHKEYQRLRTMPQLDEKKAKEKAWAMFAQGHDLVNRPRSSVIIPKNDPNKQNIEYFMENTIKAESPFVQANHKWVSTGDRQGMILLAPSNEDPLIYKPVKQFNFNQINSKVQPEPERVQRIKQRIKTQQDTKNIKGSYGQIGAALSASLNSRE